MTLAKAGSVLWNGRKPDWKGSKRLLVTKCFCSCLATVRSRTLDRRGRLEMGDSEGDLSGLDRVFEYGSNCSSLIDRGSLTKTQ